MTQKPYHYLECGLDNVWLLNGFTIIDYEGEEAISIDNIDGLHIAIASDLVKMPRKLKGQEIRFLRKELDLSQKRLGALLGRDEQTVAYWEKDQTSDPIADRFIRVLWLDVKQQNNLSAMQLMERLQELDQRDYEERLFQEIDDDWRPAA